MSDRAEQWAARAVDSRGVLAAGVLVAQKWIVSVRRDGFSQTRAEEAFRRLEECVRVLQRGQMPVGRLRWTFEEGRIECIAPVAGGQGIASLFVSKDLVRAETVEQLFAEAESFFHS
jgi:hypothetical protein